jgi:hypothetical protein
MMLVTFTWLPPSWEAMLPQKFSAATTWMVRPDPLALPVAAVLLVCEEEVEQAVAVTAVRAAVAVTSAILAVGRAEGEAGAVDMRELLRAMPGARRTRADRVATPSTLDGNDFQINPR